MILLVEVYPVSVKEIADYLGTPLKRVERSIELLSKKGLVALEPLPDKTYVTIVSGDFRFSGQETEQLKKIQELLKKRQRQSDDYDGMMYG